MHEAPREPAATGARAARRALVALALAASVAVLILVYTERFGWSYYWMRFAAFYAVRTALLLVFAALALAAFVLGVLRPRRSLRAQRLGAAVLAVALTLTLLETVFQFVPRSHNVGYTLGAQVWSFWYWDENELGYRDREHVAVPGKRLVFVVGDSFAAGAGLERTEQRFGDVLAEHLPELHVLNLGKPGSDTLDELRRLRQHPLDPDALVVQYCENDIEGALRRAGWQLPEWDAYGDLPQAVAWVVRTSFLLNYVYWRFPHGDGAAYVDMLDRALADERVLGAHLDDLEGFCDFAEARGIPIYAVVFPSMLDPACDRAATDRVVRAFVARGVPVVDVGELIREVPVAARSVNAYDAHPSARVHQLVGEALARRMSGR